MGEAPHLFCLGIEFGLKNNPPKSIWRGKTAPETTKNPPKLLWWGKTPPDNMIFPVETILAGNIASNPHPQAQKPMPPGHKENPAASKLRRGF
jgi:hypothetical protein